MEEEDIQTNSGDEFVPGDLLATGIGDTDTEDAPEAEIAVVNAPGVAENAPVVPGNVEMSLLAILTLVQ